jgi:hypothetical protein
MFLVPEDSAETTISVFHGSIGDAASILENGLEVM